MQWSEVETFFIADGSLRDIYVFNTTETEWDRLLQLAQGHFSVSYHISGEISLLPASTTGIFEDRDHLHSLGIDIGGPIVNAHFFIADEIELDLDPRQINSQRDWTKVRNFCEMLAHKINRDVIITPENEPEVVNLQYQIATGHWLKPS